MIFIMILTHEVTMSLDRSNFLSGQSPDTFQRNIGIFFKEIAKALKGPHQFSPFHEAIRSPFDFYAW